MIGRLTIGLRVAVGEGTSVDDEVGAGVLVLVAVTVGAS
jgi:hypothetical protein